MFKKIIISIGVIGLILVIIGLVLTKGDFGKLKAAFVSDEDYEYVEKTGSDLINDVDVDVDDNHVTFYKSEDESYKLEYYESEYDKIIVNVIEGRLIVRNEEKHKIRFFNWKIKSHKVSQIAIYLPQSFTGKIKTDITSGKLNISNFTLSNLEVKITSGDSAIDNLIVNGNVDIELTSGKTTINKITCYDLTVDGTSGKINLNNSLINNRAKLKVTSGDINVNDSEFIKLEAKVTSGEINLVKIKSNDIITNITSGEINIQIVGNKDEYKTILDINSGKIYYDNIKVLSQIFNPNGAKYLEAKGSSGKIIINFIN